METLPVRIAGKSVYGGFWRRLIAGMLDMLFWLPVMLLFPFVRISGYGWALISALPAAVVIVFLTIYFHARFGGTPGKLMLRLRVTKPDGAPIGWREAWMRSAVDLLFGLLFGLGEIWLLMTTDVWPYLMPFSERADTMMPLFLQRLFFLQHIWIWSEVIVLLFNRRRRAIHDFIAGTVVVKRRFAQVPIMRGKAAWTTVGVFLFGIAGIITVLCFSGQDVLPPDLSDLEREYTEIQPEENAYTYLLAASETFYTEVDDEPAWLYYRENPDDTEPIHALLYKNAEAFRLIHEGVSLGVYQPPPIRDFGDLTPHVQDWLQMARMLRLKSMVARAEGRYEDATEVCLLLIRFGALLCAEPDALIGYLVGIAVVDMGLIEAASIVRAPNTAEDDILRIADTLSPVTPFGRGLALAAKTEAQLAATLLGQYSAGMRFGDLSMVALWDSGGYGESLTLLGRIPVPKHFFQPNATLQLFADRYRMFIAHVDCVYADVPFDRLEQPLLDSSEMEKMIALPNIIGRMLYHILFPAWEGVFARRSYTEARWHGVRLLAAIQLFMRNTGGVPKELEDLVPAYLDSIPIDPFDGNTFRYNQERVVVYSVGRELVDYGGESDDPDTFAPAEDRPWSDASNILFFVHEPDVSSNSASQ